MLLNERAHICNVGRFFGHLKKMDQYQIDLIFWPENGTENGWMCFDLQGEFVIPTHLFLRKLAPVLGRENSAKQNETIWICILVTHKGTVFA